jgi:hypothetical protein
MVNWFNNKAVACRRAARSTRTSRFPQRHGQRAALLAELIAAMAILTATVLPLAFSITSELRAFKACYNQALAMEIVDGEMEVLAAGEWRSFSEGTRPYLVRANAAANLPPGKFVLTVSGSLLRLEWLPEEPGHGGKAVREAAAQ